MTTIGRAAVIALLAFPPCACDGVPGGAPEGEAKAAMTKVNGPVRIGFLHHSTGEVVWRGGVPEFIAAWNREHGTDYRITPVTYPATTGGGWPPVLRRLVQTYPWANYPYDYWNLWVRHTGSSRDRGELNLADLARRYDVVVFKHCFPVGRIGPDGPAPSVASEAKTLGNYRLQYEALKARMHQFPATRFVVWTGAALPAGATSAEEAARARSFFEWVKGVWDEPGDNVFVWDFHALETEGGLYLRPEYAAGPADGHPAPAFARTVAPLLGRRVVDVIEGRGDASSLTGGPPERGERVGR